MTARYHSLLCEPVCPGWGCECWCHDCPDAPVDEGANYTSVSYDGRTTETAPGGASTPLLQGPRPSDHPEGLAQ